MRELHESGLFFLKNGNGVVVNRIPAEVRNLRIHNSDGRVKEILGKRVFYFKDMEILEVRLQNGKFKFFQYREKKGRFIEVDSSYLSG